MLSPERIKREGIFNPQTVAALVAKFKSGRPTSTKDNMALVGILSTEILLERFMNRREPRGDVSTQPFLRGANVAHTESLKEIA